jgi:K+:H+ antiporter
MTPDQLAGRTLLAAGCAIVAGRLCSLALARVRQPETLGEIVAGLAIGQTLHGALRHGPTAWVFAPAVRTALAPVALVGLVLFMCVVGTEVDLRSPRVRGRTVLGSACGAVLLPFALGLPLAVYLHHVHRGSPAAHEDSTRFTIFVATVMAVTALPVLARILRERRMQREPTGQTAIAAAAVQDCVGWILVAVVLTLGHATGTVLGMLAKAAALLLLIVGVMRPLLRRALRMGARGTAHRPLTLVLPGLLLSAAGAQLIGLHSVIGAFAFGVLGVPRDPEVVEQLDGELIPLVRRLLLPLYFVGVGFAIDLTSLEGGMLVRELLPILAVAIVGKIAGAAIGARLAGSEWHEARTLGVLLNTRGLMELVVLQIGLTAGVIDARLFALFVIMTLVTTLMTSPLLDVLERWDPRTR